MRRILITGGSGAFGTAFVNFLLGCYQPPDRIVIYSRGEHRQEMMARDLKAWGVEHPTLRFFIGDVRDADRLELAMRGIDTIIHAAAMKVVPTAEYNPSECVATNIGGAQNIVRAALRSQVKNVLALSTDKAVNPTNLYGATKLTAEKIFIAANNLAAGQCAFSVMRYGNVAGSTGSVLPLFQRLAAQGQPITLTDERMTRFWISMDQAVAFAWKCLDMMEGREIFVPKIPSIKITDLAKVFAPSYSVVGIRPGEKIHECLISEDEARNAVEHLDHFCIQPGTTTARGINRYASDSNHEWLHYAQLVGMYGE